MKTTTFEWEEFKSKLDSRTHDEALKVLFMWVKSDHITFNQFKVLVEYVYLSKYRSLLKVPYDSEYDD